MAYGTVHDATQIDIIFPDDKDYTAELVQGDANNGVPDKIVFSNNSSWTRVANFWGGDTRIPLEGYLRRIRRRRDPAKCWLTFLQNHREVITAFDFFTVPTQ